VPNRERDRPTIEHEDCAMNLFVPPGICLAIKLVHNLVGS
jgi:hypothetical protein